MPLLVRGRSHDQHPRTVADARHTTITNGSNDHEQLDIGRMGRGCRTFPDTRPGAARTRPRTRGHSRSRHRAGPGRCGMSRQTQIQTRPRPRPAPEPPADAPTVSVSIARTWFADSRHYPVQKQRLGSRPGNGPQAGTGGHSSRGEIAGPSSAALGAALGPGDGVFVHCQGSLVSVPCARVRSWSYLAISGSGRVSTGNGGSAVVRSRDRSAQAAARPCWAGSGCWACSAGVVGCRLR